MSKAHARKLDALALQQRLSCGYQPALNVVLALESPGGGLRWEVLDQIRAATYGRVDGLGSCLDRAWRDVLSEARPIGSRLAPAGTVLCGLGQYGIADPATERVRRAWHPFARNATAFVAASGVAQTAILRFVRPFAAPGVIGVDKILEHAWRNGPPPVVGAPIDHPEIAAVLTPLRAVSRSLLATVSAADEINEALLAVSLSDDRELLIDTLCATWWNLLSRLSTAWHCSASMDMYRWTLRGLEVDTPTRWTTMLDSWADIRAHEAPHAAYSPRIARARHPLETHIP